MRIKEKIKQNKKKNGGAGSPGSAPSLGYNERLLLIAPLYARRKWSTSFELVEDEGTSLQLSIVRLYIDGRCESINK